jgi:hypothetical protein
VFIRAFYVSYYYYFMAFTIIPFTYLIGKSLDEIIVVT